MSTKIQSMQLQSHNIHCINIHRPKDMPEYKGNHRYGRRETEDTCLYGTTTGHLYMKALG